VVDPDQPSFASEERNDFSLPRNKEIGSLQTPRYCMERLLWKMVSSPSRFGGLPLARKVTSAEFRLIHTHDYSSHAEGRIQLQTYAGMMNGSSQSLQYPGCRL